MGEIRYGVELEQVKDSPLACMLHEKWGRARSVMMQRTGGYAMLTRIAHNQSVYPRDKGKEFSEGSTQSVKRKFRSQTIQRVPDGEIKTQYDKGSIEQKEIEFLFRKKVVCSEFDGRDMMKNLLRTFNAAYDYGFCCVRTGFEKDSDGDPRVSYTVIQWNDVYPAPDCRFIEDAPWYFVREWVSRDDLEALLDEDGNLLDDTYDEDTVKYIVEHDLKDGVEPNSLPMADRSKYTAPVNSVEVRTFYRRGDDEFVSYVPDLNAVLRVVENYDPRKDVPLHFLILEPDPEFPLGAPMVAFTLGQQQFADAFQTVAYNTLLLAAEPPLISFGNDTPSKFKMKPRAIWSLGTNQNARVEPFRVETTTLTQYGSILENVAANMMRNMNATDATVASDAHAANYSGTAPGVAAQRQDKTIAVNQLQKRVEVFFSDWANHALRSYINSMSGQRLITMDEEARRQIWDIEVARADAAEQQGEEPEESVIEGNQVRVDFSALSTDMLSFEVRAGSLIESQREEERKTLSELIVPVSQMMNAVSEERKPSFEDVIMKMVSRLLELSDIDVAEQASGKIDVSLLSQAMQATMERQVAQQGQIDMLGNAMAGMLGGGQGQGAPQPGSVPMPEGGAPQPGPVPMPEAGAPQPGPVPMPEAGAPQPGPEPAQPSPELLARLRAAQGNGLTA